MTKRYHSKRLLSVQGGVSEQYALSRGIHRLGRPLNSPDCRARKLSRLHSDLALQSMSIEKLDIRGTGIVAVSATPENPSRRFI